MSKAHLILLFDAPLMAFGGVAVDNYGRTDPFPSASMLTGLLGNALGLDRTEGEKLQALQDRLVYAVRIDRPGAPLMDFQTAKLEARDKAWTTRGVPEGRAGGADTYKSPHIRYRDFWADRIVRVALRFEPPLGEPTLDDVAAALEAPARPLFVGRKACLPSAPILAARVEATSALDALAQLAPLAEEQGGEWFWPEGEHDGGATSQSFDHVGRRDWISGVHGGWERWRRGARGGAAP